MLSSMFQGLKKLRYLDLSDNPLGELTPNVFMDVTVRHAEFVTIVEFLMRYFPPQDLRALKCRKCQLKNVDSHLYFYLKHLVELDLGENQVNLNIFPSL